MLTPPKLESPRSPPPEKCKSAKVQKCKMQFSEGK